MLRAGTPNEREIQAVEQREITQRSHTSVGDGRIRNVQLDDWQSCQQKNLTQSVDDVEGGNLTALKKIKRVAHEGQGNGGYILDKWKW